MKKNLLRTHKKLISLFALALVVLGGGYFGHAALGWYSISTDNSVTVNIITGTSAQDKQSLTVAKGSCTSFTLSTKTKTSDQYGYTLSAYTSGTSGSTMPSGISIKKSDNTTIVSTSSTSPTEVIKTTSANTTLDNTSTTYYACADSNIADGSYDVNFGYVLAENPITLADVVKRYGITNMQDLTSAMCNEANTDFTGTNTDANAHLIDTRNGYYYWVGKLADGKCWMLENLQLDGASMLATTDPDSNTRTAVTTLDSSNTNLPSGNTLTASATAQIGAPLGTFPSAVTSGASTRNFIDVSNPGNNTATVYHVSTSALGNSNITDYGYLYNWCAAVGGQSTACTDSNTMPTATSGDICPKGWRMPSGDDTGEFAILNGYMNGGTGADVGNYYQNWLAGSGSPFRGVFAGYFSSRLYQDDLRGYVLSSSYYYYSSYMMLGASFSSSYVDPGSYVDQKSSGHAVRCVIG